MRFPLGWLAISVLAGCSRGSSVAPPAGDPVPSVIPQPPPTGTSSAPALPSSSAASSTSPPGSGSAVPPLAYRHYINDRFGFAVDYPAFFAASEPPTNGDGQEWTWGTRATMRAWGMHALEQTVAEVCDADAKENPTFFKKVTGKTCLLTGKKGTTIVWQKRTLASGLIFGLELEYDDALKATFDPLVEHVNASQRTDLPAEGP